MPLSSLSLSPNSSSFKKNSTSIVSCLPFLLLFSSLFFSQRSLPLTLLPQSFSTKIQPQSTEIDGPDNNRPSQSSESPSNIDPTVEEPANGVSRKIDNLSPILNLSPLPLLLGTEEGVLSRIDNLISSIPEEGVLRRGNGKGGCNLCEGRWVKDEEGRCPLYVPGSCPYVDGAFTCQENEREDGDFMKWRWKPNDYKLPRLTISTFLHLPREWDRRYGLYEMEVEAQRLLILWRNGGENSQDY